MTSEGRTIEHGAGRELAFYGVVLAALASLLPLYDPDLPMHLALGEWIVQHRALPVTEPFAWTRAGDPYFAYSWLPQVTFYLTHAALGPIGLRVLQGALIGGAFASTVLLGRAAGWTRGAMLMMAAGSVLVAGLVTPSLRPQVVLLIVVPLVWRVMLRMSDTAQPTLGSLGALVLLSALAANSHLFFPVLLAPVALLLVAQPVNWPRVSAAAAAIATGWLLTPYLLHWPAIFATNFASNALLAWPSPIAELQPGFHAIVAGQPLLLAPVLLLALVPWVFVPPTPRERALAGAYWIAGLLAFGLASRMLLAWWLLCLPFLGVALSRIGATQADPPPRPAVRRLGNAALAVLLVMSIVRTAQDWRREGTVGSRTLATWLARSAEAPAAWLEQNAQPASTVRIFTVFNYGSYLTWRLPGYSSSIDSRTIFPDSVALAEALGPPVVPPVLGPWRSADVAIVPLNRPVVAALDSAPEWRRVMISAPAGAPDTSALWIREDWWAANRRAAAP